MPKFLLKVAYNAEGTKGLLKEGGSARRATVAEMISAQGGKLETFLYAPGGTTVYAISDLPDNVTATALTLVIRASGLMDVLESIPLVSPEEIDQAARKVINYRSPGK